MENLCQKCVHRKVCSISKAQKIFNLDHFIQSAITECEHHMAQSEFVSSSVGKITSPADVAGDLMYSNNYTSYCSESAVLNKLLDMDYKDESTKDELLPEIKEPIYCPSCETVKDKSEFDDDNICETCGILACNDCIITNTSNENEAHKICEKCWSK